VLQAGTQYVRYANEAGTEGNPQIGGTEVAVTSATGFADVSTNVLGYVPGYVTT
jgi:hypothetical protein